jgi:hypothetical protein
VARSGGGRGQPARINFTYKTYTYPTWRQSAQPDIAEIGSAVVGLLSTVTVQKTVATSVICSLGAVARGAGQKSVAQMAAAYAGLSGRANATRGSVSTIAYVTQYGPNAIGTTSPDTLAVTVAAGDMLVVGAWVQFSGVGNFNTPSGGGLTYTSRAVGTTNPSSACQLWSAPSASGQTFTLTDSNTTGGGRWAFCADRFSGVGSIGNTASATGSSSAPQVSITTTAANSAIVVLITNHAGDNLTLAYLTGAGTFVQTTRQNDASVGDVYGGYYINAGAAGAKTIGTSTVLTGQWNIIAVELIPGGTADNRAQTSNAAIGVAGLALAKKTTPTVIRAPIGLVAYRSIYSAAVLTRAALGVTALATPVKNAVVAVRVGVGVIGRATDVKTASTQTSGALGAHSRATESRNAAVMARGTLGAISRITGLARTAPVISVAYGGVLARPASAKAAVTSSRAPVGLTSATTPRKVAIVVDRVPIGVIALRSGVGAIPTSALAVIGVTVRAITVKQAPASSAAPVGVLGASRAAKTSAQHVSSPIGISVTSRAVKRAVVLARGAAGVMGRTLVGKVAASSARVGVGAFGYATPRKAATVYTRAPVGITGLAGVRKLVAVSTRVYTGVLPVVVPAKSVPARVSSVIGLAAFETLILPPWPPHAGLITITRPVQVEVVVTTSSHSPDTEITTAASVSTEITEPSHGDTEITRPASGDTDLTH